jgi:hypothetical protein
MDVSLEEYVTVVLRFVPEAVCTDAVKTKVAPIVRDALVDGVKLMRPGNKGGPGWDPPPHPMMVEKEQRATARRKLSQRNLPMHSSSFIDNESQLCPLRLKDARELNSSIRKPVV